MIVSNELSLADPASYCVLFTRRVLDSTAETVFMTILTVYALFADDLRMAVFSKSIDDVFYGFSSVCFVSFMLELGLTLYVRKRYRWSFYFALDLISTLALLPDIGWIWNPIIGTNDSNQSSQINQVTNAGKTSRAGGRASRVVRIVRLIRLLRLAKLYKTTQHTYLRTRIATTTLHTEESDVYQPEESHIGKEVTESTSKRVIALVLSILILFPLYELSFYVTQTTSWEFATQELDYFKENRLAYLQIQKTFVDYHKNSKYPLIFHSLSIDNSVVIWKSTTDPNSLRLEEKFYAISGAHIAIFDLRYETRLTAGLSILQTIFVCVVLAIGTVYFTEDAHNMVVVPIEKMMNKVRRLVRNPQDIIEGKVSEAFDSDVVKPAKWWQKLCCLPVLVHDSQLETSLLENALLKIGSLLAIGFGEAGSRIIAETLAKEDALNEIAEGVKVTAIYGFCDIRNFTDVTEVLQEDVITFVNEVADLVHHTVDQYLGAANKNIGDAFLVVWRFPPEAITYRGAEVNLISESPVVQNLADLAVIAFLKIVVRLNRYPSMLRYRTYPEIIERLPNFTVRLGFGLHVGWAIEGAIGSPLKIDASYLSLHVNLAIKLEEITKFYGVAMLISGSVHRLLSPYIQHRCRHIDTVSLGLLKNLRLYTFDLSLSELLAAPPRFLTKNKSKEKRLALIERLSGNTFTAFSLLSTSKSLEALTSTADIDYNALFGEAIELYEQGQWSEARNLLIECKSIRPNDIPTTVVMKYMELHDNKAPVSWKGYRTNLGKKP